MEPVPPGCGGRVLDGGDTGESLLAAAARLVLPLLPWWGGGGVEGRGGAAGGGVSTLLGPEGTTVFPFGPAHDCGSAALFGGWWVWWWLWGWLLVEMCIVDASICRHAGRCGWVCW